MTKTRCTFSRLFVLALLLACTQSVTGSPSVEESAITIFKAFTRNKQIESDFQVSSESAIAVQDFYIALLRPTWGMDVGYASQAMSVNGVSALPPTGILLENMFTGTRAIVDRSYGVNMHAAAEILFRVGSDELNIAVTRADALEALHSVIPGVRLSDVLLKGTKPHDQSIVSATNLEVRFCVLGGELKLDTTGDWMDRLSKFSVVMFDQNKNQIKEYENPASNHPLDAILMMRDALHQRGIQVQKSDILALGPITEGVAVEDLSRLRAVFHGLSDDQPVFVYMGFR